MVKSALLSLIVLVVVGTVPVASFLGYRGIPGVAGGADTKLGFGFNGLGGDKSDDADSDGADGKPEKKITAGGLVQLITAGMGAPFLGDYKGVDKDGKMMFSLEANNLVDENGNSKQTQMPYFENGWVEEKGNPEPDAKTGGSFKLPWQK